MHKLIISKSQRDAIEALSLDGRLAGARRLANGRFEIEVEDHVHAGLAILGDGDPLAGLNELLLRGKPRTQ